MKQLFSMFVVLLMTSFIMVGCSSNTPKKSTPEINITASVAPSDGLDLKLVGALLQEGKVKDAQGLEQELNKDGGINNLDLNSDGSVDYINVSENQSDNASLKSFDLTTGDTSDLTHIATVEVEKKGEEYHINMSGSEGVYGQGHHYHSHFHPTGEMLFYAWLFSPRPYYYHRPYYHGYYPSYYGGPRVVVSRASYMSRTTTQRQTASKSITRTKTSNTKVQSKNKGKTSKSTRSSVNAHNKQTKQMKSRNTSKPVSKGGFTKNTNNKSTTPTKKSTSTKKSSWGSSSKKKSSWGSSGKRRSDSTYKVNVVNYNNGLSTVMKLNSVYYYWSPEIEYEAVVGDGYLSDTSRQVGFLAQEVERLVPEVVNEDEFGKTVSYDLLVPVLVEAIQEQQRQIDSLKVVISNK